MITEYLKTHLFYVLLIAGAIFAGHSWLVEHDNRLLAEQQAKISEADARASASRVVDLEASLASTQAARDDQVATLEHRLASVKTPAQALPVVQELAPALKPEVASSPNSVSVDTIELAKELTQCREDKVSLDACQVQLKTEQQIVVEKDSQLKDKQDEIVALKKPQKFWKRLGTTVKTFGTGVGVGVAVAILLGGHAL